MTREHEDLLRLLALNDEGAVGGAIGPTAVAGGHPGLDAKAEALVRLAGLVALGSTPASYQWGVTAALAAGATDDEVVGVLVALASVVGVARVNAAAPHLALAIGYDLDTPEAAAT